MFKRLSKGILFDVIDLFEPHLLVHSWGNFSPNRHTMRDRTQGQSTSKENLVYENIDIDEAIRKFVATRTKRQNQK